MTLHISSGSPMEPIIGFCRAVKSGPHVWIAGTAAIAQDGGVACPGDVHGQTRRCIEIAKAALEEAGATLDNVVRTRVLLLDIADWRHAARAHGEAFGAVRPVTTVMQVSRFIDPGWLIEMEFDAYVEGQ